MAATHQLLHLLLRQIDFLSAAHLHQNSRHLIARRCRGATTKQRAVARRKGHIGHVVLVAETTRFFKHAHNRERLAVDANPLANRIGRAKNLFCQHIAQDHDIARGLFHLLVDKLAPRHLEITNDGVLGRSAAYLHILADRATHNLARALKNRRHVLDLGHTPRHRSRVIQRQLHVCRRWTAIPLLAGEQIQEVGANALDLVGDRLLGAIADRHERDHRPHADDDAQHGQKGAQLVGSQAFQRNADAFPSPSHQARRPSLRQRTYSIGSCHLWAPKELTAIRQQVTVFGR